MSSSYTTTTSATGMPSLDIDCRRNNANSLQDDRHSRTPSPSPKANRAKSYAGIYNRPEIRREFVKSRSFCQASPPDARNNTLLKGYDDDEFRDSIFKTELSCSDSNFADDHINDNFTDDELFEVENAKNDVEMNVDSGKTDRISENPAEASSSVNSTTRNEERRLPLVSDTQGNDGSGIVKPVPIRPDCLQSPDQRRSLLFNRKLENLNVAQVAPVRKNSRDESALRVMSSDGHSSRRGSGVSTTLSAQIDWQSEIAVAASKEVQEKMDQLLSWEFPIFELSESCHILTQVGYFDGNIFRVLDGFECKHHKLG